MTVPTGSISVVKKRMDEARELENFLAVLIEQQLFHTAITIKTQVEASKSLAGMEFLLWMLAVINMAEEPKPWEEAKK